jgi:hypothetical protein
MTTTASLPLTIRPARAGDAPALWRLAALDSAPLPAEPLLIAEVDGEIRVAVSASDSRAIADPFVPTAHIVELLRDHIARGVRVPGPARGRREAAPALRLRAA